MWFTGILVIYPDSLFSYTVFFILHLYHSSCAFLDSDIIYIFLIYLSLSFHLGYMIINCRFMWNCILLILQNGGDDVGMIYDDKLPTKQRLDSSQNKMGQLINGIDH